jgi:outer membrane scaffolding protein for murein synthesis (MipA/OmpV family)
LPLETDWGRRDIGFLGVVAAGHRFGPQLDGTGTEVFVFSTFGNGDFINRDSGITATEWAASGLAETHLDGGYRSVGIPVTDRLYLTEHIHLITQGGIEFYSDDIQDSSIAREDYEAEVGVSVLCQF